MKYLTQIYLKSLLFSAFLISQSLIYTVLARIPDIWVFGRHRLFPPFNLLKGTAERKGKKEKDVLNKQTYLLASLFISTYPHIHLGIGVPYLLTI